MGNHHVGQTSYEACLSTGMRDRVEEARLPLCLWSFPSKVCSLPRNGVRRETTVSKKGPPSIFSFYKEPSELLQYLSTFEGTVPNVINRSVSSQDTPTHLTYLELSQINHVSILQSRRASVRPQRRPRSRSSQGGMVAQRVRKLSH
jgi:hypothetical protein